MKTIKIQLKNAELVRKYLIRNELIDHDHNLEKDKDFMYLPITDFNKVKKQFPFIERSSKRLKKMQRQATSLKDALSGKLTEKELSHLKTAHDTIGQIAILEIDRELAKRERLIANTLLKTNKNIKTVLKKSGEHEGVFRTQKLKYLAGKKTKEAIYKENNITLKLDVEKVYFSPRLAEERKRIISLVKPDEEILVMFSGCGPYSIGLAKNTKAKHITAIEINPVAHKYALENALANNAFNVTSLLGDVRKVMPKLKQKFDRLLMPLPRTADEFLDLALKSIKVDGTIHFYDFLHENDIPKLAIEKIDKACAKEGRNYKVITYTKCGQFSPHVYRVCVDVKILS